MRAICSSSQACGPRSITATAPGTSSAGQFSAPRRGSSAQSSGLTTEPPEPHDSGAQRMNHIHGTGHQHCGRPHGQLQPAVPVMPVSSEGIGLGRITAGQTDTGIWPRRAASALLAAGVVTWVVTDLRSWKSTSRITTSVARTELGTCSHRTATKSLRSLRSVRIRVAGEQEGMFFLCSRSAGSRARSQAMLRNTVYKSSTPQPLAASCMITNR
jgi:hypothetical protein